MRPTPDTYPLVFSVQVNFDDTHLFMETEWPDLKSISSDFILTPGNLAPV